MAKKKGKVGDQVERDPIPPPPVESAPAAAEEGPIVIIEATIDTNGRVSATRLLRSVPLLDEAALAAVRQWVFTPPVYQGQPVAAEATRSLVAP